MMRHASAATSLISLTGFVSCISAPVSEVSTTTNYTSDAQAGDQGVTGSQGPASRGEAQPPTFTGSQGRGAPGMPGVMSLGSRAVASQTVVSALQISSDDGSNSNEASVDISSNAESNDAPAALVGQGSTSGPLPDATLVPNDSPLLGLYDVHLAEVPEVRGCRPEFGSTHFHVVLEANNELDVEARVSSDFGYPHVVSSAANTQAVRLSSNPSDSPEFTFALDSAGKFSGVGQASIHYTCESTTTARMVPVTIGPDVTPARSRVTHDFPTDSTVLGGAVPVGVMLNVEFSEMVDLGGSELRMAPALHQELEQLVAVVDDETSEILRTRANFNFAGGVSLEFADFDEAKNRDVRVEFLYEVTDRAGHPVAAPTQVFHVMDVRSLETAIDFDDGNDAGVWGNARYVAAGTADSPCESGGCVVIDEEVPLCEDWQAEGPTSSFNFRLPLPQPTDSFRVRSRLLSTHATTASTRLWWNRGCNLEVIPTVLPSLTEATGLYTYGTEWTDTDMSLSACAGEGEDKNLALTLTCVHAHSMPPEGIRVRYVIERIERSAP